MYEQTKEMAASYQRAVRDVPEAIKEPNLVDRARETCKFLSELEGLMEQLRVKLYGPVPPQGDTNGKSTHEPSLEELVAHACEHSAMAVGELKTILNRL